MAVIEGSWRGTRKGPAQMGEKPVLQERPSSPGAEEVSAERTVAAAVATAAAAAEEGQPFGNPGRPFNRRSPFFVGMTAAAGVAVTYGLIQLIVSARDVLALIGLALFLAIGLDPAVAWLVRRGLPRALSVLAILAAAFGLLACFLALAIPALVEQGGRFVRQLPGYVQSLQDKSSFLGALNQRFQLQQRLADFASGKANLSLATGLLGAGQVVVGAAVSVLVVCVLTVYFLADMSRIKTTLYRCVPHSRRPRVILIGDEILAKVGGFVLGNLLTSLIAGVATFIWLQVFGVPYSVLLGLFVALVDLVPVVGSTLGGVVVALVAVSVSIPVAIGTVIFFVAYRFVEDYLLVPKIMGRTVEVPGVVTVIAVLVGGTLLGMIGALVAIPVAAALRLFLREVAFPRLDRS
ncbi:AI-2E family transporter [Streptosporangiaceae bacterium NEAU-GS5]|nr:AI-2E family transporter [Streptosporangiaceae bacterium NEAU-GS5]